MPIRNTQLYGELGRFTDEVFATEIDISLGEDRVGANATSLAAQLVDKFGTKAKFIDITEFFEQLWKQNPAIGGTDELVHLFIFRLVDQLCMDDADDLKELITTLNDMAHDMELKDSDAAAILTGALISALHQETVSGEKE